MSDDDLGERLRRLGLRVGHEALTAFLTHVHKSRLGPTETLEQLADLEDRARVAVNLARRTRFACLGSFKTIDRFDWAHPEKIDRPLIERLLELEFIDRGENALLKGASGLGKTMIAQNVAQTALAAGFTVRFSTLAAALADLLGQESLPAFERRLRRYTHPDLLVLDERARVFALRLACCRHPLQYHQPSPRAALHDHHDQPGIQAMGHHVPRRRVCRRARRSVCPALPSHRDPRRVLA